MSKSEKKEEKRVISLSNEQVSLKDTLINLLYFHTWSGNEQIMQEYLLNKLKKLGFDANVDEEGNIYATRGKAEKYPLLNAHMDIVYNLNRTYENKVYKPKVVTTKSNCICYGCTFLDLCVSEIATKYKIDYDSAARIIKHRDECLYEAFEEAEPEMLELNKEIVKIAEKTSGNRGLYDTDVDYNDNTIYGGTRYIYSYVKTDEKKREIDKQLIDDYEIRYDKYTGKITGSGQRVLGGDDKCGIALALHMASIHPDLPMKILFTTEEESGCWGVSSFVQLHADWFDDVKYSITIDRRGDSDLLRWSCSKENCSWGFAAKLAYYGIMAKIPVTIENGSVADVIYIRDLVPEAVNISAGYNSPHTTSEWIDFPAMCKIANWLSNTITNI